MISVVKHNAIRLIKEREVFVGTRELEALALVPQYNYLSLEVAQHILPAFSTIVECQGRTRAKSRCC